MLKSQDLEKEVPPRVLYPLNPRAAHNTTQYSFKEKCFKVDEQVDQVVMHFAMDGLILLKESPEAMDQIEVFEKKEAEQNEKEEAEAIDEDFDPPENEKEPLTPILWSIAGHACALFTNLSMSRTFAILMYHTLNFDFVLFLSGTQEIPVKNPLRNQFNFSERAAQSKNAILRERSWTTEPPPTTRNYGTVTQWEIFDQYMAEIEAAKEKEKDDKKSGKSAYDDMSEKKKKSDSDPTYSENMKLSIKIMERMVNQNAENEVYHDFKYWEDRSDEFRDGEGTLLPLWRFSSEKAKKKQVTCIKWNPHYSDLCAVGFGSYDFMRQGTGVICCYSLKNTRFPEYVFNTDAGDWHPAHPAVLAVGLYDGTVLVYDVRARTKKPIYQSTVRTNKHTDPVWEVRWNNDESTGALNFYSISSDGRVSNWFLLKNKLESEEVMELKLMGSPGTGEEDETSLAGLAGGLCFDFHSHTQAFSGQYLETYEGHTMAVYSVRWNPFHEKIFISASADWTVKLWNHEMLVLDLGGVCMFGRNRFAILSFDLSQAIGDVAWAPYSSTTFAAITSDVNRNDHICAQKVVKRAKLTHVAFSKSEPIIIVGDDRGGVNTLKLSPNLRIDVDIPVDAVD
eukprot:g22949.t1